MIRQIIKINEDKCNGCGLCVTACHEGAIDIIDGKAKLIRDDYCDGLGNCLPVCPTGAITFEEREALEFDQKAVQENNKQKHDIPHSCPSVNARKTKTKDNKINELKVEKSISQLNQWPVQIKLVPFNAPYFDNADLLIAADCTAYAYANIHNEFMKNKITIIGCPKLDDEEYEEKLSEILEHNNINSITVLVMEVPCCRGLVHAVKEALRKSNQIIPWQIHTITIDGDIL